MNALDWVGIAVSLLIVGGTFWLIRKLEVSVEVSYRSPWDE